MIASNLNNWLTSSISKGEKKASDTRAALSLLTVVIPCYGRQDFLLRQCVYWHGSGASIVIVDGSPKPLDLDTKKILATLDDITYLYSPTTVMMRLNIASKYIQTRYAILLGDDEFLLFSGLCSAISKLENDAGLVAVIGQSIAFYPTNKNHHCSYGAGYPHWKLSVTQDNVEARFQAAMSNYTAATCYAVLRTPVWCKSWGRQESWSSPYAGEIQQALTTYIWGKLTTVDEVYWMRSSENSPVNIKEFNRGLSFEEWWASSTKNTEHAQFIHILSNELVSAKGIAVEDAEAIIRKAVATYVQHIQKINVPVDEVMKNPQAFVAKLRSFGVRTVKSLLPVQAYEYIKSVLFNARSVRGEGELGGLSDLKQGASHLPFAVTEDLIAELSEMEALIASFYTARKGETA